MLKAFTWSQILSRLCTQRHAYFRKWWNTQKTYFRVKSSSNSVVFMLVSPCEYEQACREKVSVTVWKTRMCHSVGKKYFCYRLVHIYWSKTVKNGCIISKAFENLPQDGLRICISQVYLLEHNAYQVPTLYPFSFFLFCQLFLCHLILIPMVFEVVNQVGFFSQWHLHICYHLSFPILGRAGKLKQEG